MSKFNPTLLRSTSNDDTELEIENNDLNRLNSQPENTNALRKHTSFTEGSSNNRRNSNKQQINEQPQDYVVTNGKVYRLSKSPRPVVESFSPAASKQPTDVVRQLNEMSRAL